MGEVVLEVGAPGGWGPVGLAAGQLEAVLGRLMATAAAHNANVSITRKRTAQLQAGPDQGGC